MRMLALLLFSPWGHLLSGIFAGGLAAYLWHAYMEYKWPFRGEDSQVDRAGEDEI